MVETEFAKRLEIVIGSESVHAFSKKVRVSDTMMRKYLDGSMPGLTNLLQISETTGVTLDWLAAGRGPMRAQDRPENLISLSPDEHRALYRGNKDDTEGYTLIPRFDVSASAGGGIIAYEEDALDFLGFRNEWLRARNIRAEFARLLTAKGDSMLETIHDGDSLLIDTSINHFKDNAIYVLIFGNMVLVKRIHARMNGSVQLISDNPRYPVEEVTAGEVDQITVAGRVMWFGRTM